jgi:hypothetical protein
MSLVTDLRAVSENAIEQVAARFPDLPRPLLAAIGAGDMAVERLAELREEVGSTVSDRVAGGPLDLTEVRATVSDLPSRAQHAAAGLQGKAQQAAGDLPGRAQKFAADVQDRTQHAAADLSGRAQKMASDLPGRAQKMAADLPGRAQKAAADLPGKAQQVAADLPTKAQQVASDVAGNIEQFAADAPGKAQNLISQLPGKVSEFSAAAKSLSPEALSGTVEAYTQLVGMIYGKLAERGERSWSRARGAGRFHGSVVDAAKLKASATPQTPSTPTAPAPDAASEAGDTPAPSTAEHTTMPEHPPVVPPGAHVKIEES